MAIANRPSIHEGDHVFKGAVQLTGSVDLPSSSVGDDEVASARPLKGNKTYRRIPISYNQGNVAAASITTILYTSFAAGTILEIRAGNIVRATGAATVTIDIQNSAGTSMLTAPIQLDSTHPASAGLQFINGTLIGSPDYTTDEAFKMIITATAGGGVLPTGLFVGMIVDEAPA